MKNGGRMRSTRISLAIALTAAALCAAAAANADTIQLTCREVSLTSPIFSNTGGVSDTTAYHRSLQISLDPILKSVDVSSSSANSMDAGSFPVDVADANYQWNGNVAYKNGYTHFVLDRYTMTMQGIGTPLPGHQVIQLTTNYECKTLQRQI
jgi:hypothetical protein